MHSKARVRSLLEVAGFSVTDRPDHPKFEIRDFLYASKS